MYSFSNDKLVFNFQNPGPLSWFSLKISMVTSEWSVLNPDQCYFDLFCFIHNTRGNEKIIQSTFDIRMSSAPCKLLFVILIIEQRMVIWSYWYIFQVLAEYNARGGDSKTKSEEKLWAKFEKKINKNPRLKVHKERVKLVSWCKIHFIEGFYIMKNRKNNYFKCVYLILGNPVRCFVRKIVYILVWSFGKYVIIFDWWL